MKIFLAISFLLTLLYSKNPNPVTDELKPTIILISLDGFHPSYFERYKNGYLHSIAREGISTKGMIPVFPSKTFPNHYRLITSIFII